MSVYQSFPNSEAALAAFELGQCRRHVEVGGHVIDLVQAMNPINPADSDVYGAGQRVPTGFVLRDRETHDRAVEREIAFELRCAVAVAPARPKPGPLCPCCLRPEAP